MKTKTEKSKTYKEYPRYNVIRAIEGGFIKEYSKMIDAINKKIIDRNKTEKK